MAPTAKFNPARRNPRVGVQTLPAAGYQGDIPPWPLRKTPDTYERELWEEVWRYPQAAQWVLLGRGIHRTVAMFVRAQLAVEEGTGSAAELRRFRDDLGLTPAKMRTLLWVIGNTDDDDTEGDSPTAGLPDVDAVDDDQGGV